jgi:hypothetical protein
VVKPVPAQLEPEWVLAGPAVGAPIFQALPVVQWLAAFVSKLSDQQAVSARPVPAVSHSAAHKPANMFLEPFIYLG